MLINRCLLNTLPWPPSIPCSFTRIPSLSIGNYDAEFMPVALSLDTGLQTRDHVELQQWQIIYTIPMP